MSHLPVFLLVILLGVGIDSAIPVLCQASGAEHAAYRQVSISIKGMMCSSCGQEIEKSLKKVAGVTEVKVDVPNDLATVSYDERKVTPRQLAEVIRKAGYEAKLQSEGHSPPPSGR